MAKKNRNIHTPPDPSFHPPILSSKLSKALVLQLCWRYFASDPKWKMENDTNRSKAIPRASSSHQNHHGTAPRLLGKMRGQVIRGVIPGWFHTTNAGFFGVKRSPRSLRLSMLRSYGYSSPASLSECQLWNPASCNDREQITTNFSSLGGCWIFE